MPIKRVLLLFVILAFIECAAFGQTGDLGAQIIAEDAALGTAPGEIHVSTSGTISEGRVALSAGHDLVCDDQVTISLNSGSYLYQNSNTSIENCIISSTSTPISGEIQSTNGDQLKLENVTFVGGGNLVYWVGVTNFTISDNTVVSISAFDPATHAVQSGYYLVNCSQGVIDNLTATNFQFPPGSSSFPAIVMLNLSNNITIDNISISNIDASFAFGGSGIQINGSSQISVNGGSITHTAMMDGITTQSYGISSRGFGLTPSSNVTISGMDLSYNGLQGGNATAPLSVGDGIDVINTSHVRISNCTILGSGYLGNRQPAIWLFLDNDVVVSDSDLSDGSMGGLDIAGSLSVSLINNSINRNQASGTFAEHQAGTATNVGATVTFVNGVSGGFGLSWPPGTLFSFDGTTYPIASVSDAGTIVLATAPPSHTSPVSWGVDSNLQILGGVIDDNGLGGFGGQDQVGINWVDATSGIISGVIATNTGVGAQLYGLRIDNTASALLLADSFSGNLDGGNGIFAGPQAASPSSLSFPAQGVSTTSAAQTVTLNAGAIVLQNLAIQISGGFSQTNNCESGLAAYAACQIQVTYTPTASGALNGTLTIVDAAPNSPQIVSLAGTGVSQGLGLVIATSSSNSATVAAGATATYSLSIGSAGMSGTASLSCAGAPPAATCNLPATQAFTAAQATTFTVSVKTMAPSVGEFRPAGSRRSPWLWALVMMGWVFVPAGFGTKRLVRWRILGPLCLLLCVCLCSCGGSAESRGTPAGNYSLMVTATVGNTVEQIPLTLSVK
jgi:hypothetical protein